MRAQRAYTKSIQGVRGTVGPGTEERVNFTSESLSFKKTGEASSTRDDLPLLQENLNSDNSKKNQQVVAHKVQRKNNRKKKKCKFWCEMCRVGVSSQKAMNDHKNGKKHSGRIQENNRNGEAGPSNQKERVVILMNHEGVAEEGKNIASNVVDETFDEARSEDHDPIDRVKPEDHELVDQTKPDVDLTLLMRGGDEPTVLEFSS